MPVLTLTFPLGYDATAVSLTALTRTDTGATIAGLPLAFTESSAGSRIWSATWAAPTPGLTYAYAGTATIGGVADPFSGTYVDAAGTYTGRYTSTTRLEQVYGARVVDSASNTSGGTSPVRDSAAVQYAIQVAEDDIDARLTVAYTVPFTGTIPSKLTFWATRRAMWQLDSKRTARDDDFGKMLDKQIDDDSKEISLYLIGVRRLPGTVASTNVTGGTGYVPWTDVNGNPIDRNLSAWLEGGRPVNRFGW